MWPPKSHGTASQPGVCTWGRARPCSSRMWAVRGRIRAGLLAWCRHWSPLHCLEDWRLRPVRCPPLPRPDCTGLGPASFLNQYNSLLLLCLSILAPHCIAMQYPGRKSSRIMSGGQWICPDSVNKELLSPSSTRTLLTLLKSTKPKSYGWEDHWINFIPKMYKQMETGSFRKIK